MSKHFQAVWAIAQQSVGGGFITAVPTPGYEIPKHAALSANEVALCIRIAQIYSGMKYSKDEIQQLLTDAGITVGVGLGLAYGATKAGHGMVNELLNAGGPPAWIIKGVVAGSLTAGVGFSFMAFCEARWGAD